MLPVDLVLNARPRFPQRERGGDRGAGLVRGPEGGEEDTCKVLSQGPGVYGGSSIQVTPVVQFCDSAGSADLR